jgi:hypothetical protein
MVFLVKLDITGIFLSDCNVWHRISFFLIGKRGANYAPLQNQSINCDQQLSNLQQCPSEVSASASQAAHRLAALFNARDADSAGPYAFRVDITKYASRIEGSFRMLAMGLVTAFAPGSKAEATKRSASLCLFAG